MVILGVIYGTKQTVDEAKIENAFKIILFFALLPSAISFYLFYFLVFPKYLQNKNVFAAIIYSLSYSVGAAVIGYILVIIITKGKCRYEGEDASETGIIIFMSFITLVNGIIASVIRGFITFFDEIKLKEKLKHKNHEMEMALIKSQLDPHFLFNTLNNIDILILKDATEASNYLNKLSDIMRFMLFETKPAKIPLSKEIEYIEKYIELQKIRTTNSNYVNFTQIGSAINKTIAPMVFIPFIENAFKHTTNKKLENAIIIKIRIEEDSIHFECENKFNAHQKVLQEYHGLGNDLIKKRLRLMYPDKHTLLVTDQNNIYHVSLTIFNG